jgi:hypothetical protein
MSAYFVAAAGMHIIVMLPQVIIMGMPMAIIFIMDSQRSRIMSMVVPSMGITLQVMPSLPISRVQRQVIGVMPIIMLGIMPGIIEPIMPGIIMLGIIGIMPIMFGIIMLGIIGIMPGIIMPIMLGIIGIMPGIIMPGIIEVCGIAGMFMAAIMVRPSSLDVVRG